MSRINTNSCNVLLDKNLGNVHIHLHLHFRGKREIKVSLASQKLVHCLNGLCINDNQMLTKLFAYYLGFITWPSDDIPIGAATCCSFMLTKQARRPHLYTDSIGETLHF
jgi:hypothetical protein